MTHTLFGSLLSVNAGEGKPMTVQGETIITGFDKRPTGGAVRVEAVPAPSVAAPGWSSGSPSPPAGRLHARTNPDVDELILPDTGTGIALAPAAPPVPRENSGWPWCARSPRCLVKRGA
jgi:hypothetical protein